MARSTTSGTIVYDAANPTQSSVQATIQAASIDTRHDGRDKHLRSADFFDVEQYPEITFQSTRVESAGDGLVLIGNLMMHGVTKEIRVPFRVTGTVKDPRGRTLLAAEGETTLDRRDYGIVWNKNLDNGGLAVGDEVKVLLTVEAVKQEPEAPSAH